MADEQCTERKLTPTDVSELLCADCQVSVKAATAGGTFVGFCPGCEERIANATDGAPSFTPFFKCQSTRVDR